MNDFYDECEKFKTLADIRMELGRILEKNNLTIKGYVNQLDGRLEKISIECDYYKDGDPIVLYETLHKIEDEERACITPIDLVTM